MRTQKLTSGLIFTTASSIPHSSFGLVQIDGVDENPDKKENVVASSDA